ncbi:unnamed protein product [Malus baccata var. baccata]
MADFNVSLEKAKFFLQSQYHDEEKWALNMPCYTVDKPFYSFGTAKNNKTRIKSASAWASMGFRVRIRGLSGPTSIASERTDNPTPDFLSPLGSRWSETPCAPGAWREILARGACNMTAEHRHNNPHDVVRSRGASRGPYNLLGSYGTRLADLAPCCRMAHTCHIGSERQRERILSIPRRGFLI